MSAVEVEEPCLGGAVPPHSDHGRMREMLRTERHTRRMIGHQGLKPQPHPAKLKVCSKKLRRPCWACCNCAKWFSMPMLKVYASQGLSAWGDRMWWFAGGIFMKDLGGKDYDSLMLTGVFTLVLSGAVVSLGGTVGRWVDRTPRLQAALKALLAQNILLIICAITISLMYFEWKYIHTQWDGWLLVTLQAAAIASAALSRVASVATTIIVQRDWIIILAEGDMDHLARINAVFRSIDLTAQVLAPVCVGLIQDQTSKLTSAIFIGSWNLISMCIEYSLLVMIYQENPQLAVKQPPKKHEPKCTEKYAEHDVCPEADIPHVYSPVLFHLYVIFYDWKLYFQQSVHLAGLGLAFLYMTVLGFDAITTAFGNTQITTTNIAITQGAAAIVGMLGSLSFPPLRRWLGLNRVGVVGLSLEVLALTTCVASVWLPGSPFVAAAINPAWRPSNMNTTNVRDPENHTQNVEQITSVATLFGGLVASRFGLWLTDITITQIFQENVKENKRGVINGVQDAMNMGMDMVKSLLVIIYAYPEQFGFLIVLSFLFVFSGLVSYVFFYLGHRNTEETQPHNNSSQIDYIYNKGDGVKPEPPRPDIHQI